MVSLIEASVILASKNVMPETNYKAAVKVIERWEKEFPDTYKKLKEIIDMPVKKFVEKANCVFK